MCFTIPNEISGRMRAKCDLGHMDEAEARGISYELMRVDGVRHAEVHMANGSLLRGSNLSKREPIHIFLYTAFNIILFFIPSSEIAFNASSEDRLKCFIIS